METATIKQFRGRLWHGLLRGGMAAAVLILSAQAPPSKEEISLRTARQAYQAGDYGLAAKQYEALVERHPAFGAQLLFNRGQAFFALDSTRQASAYYNRLADRLAPGPKAAALNNLGWLHVQAGREKVALSYFRDALVENPANEKARYNYELLKLRREKPPVNPPPPPPLPPSSQQDQPVPTEQHGSREMPTVSTAEAMEMLDRLRTDQRQYLQQLPKRLRDPEHFSDIPEY